MKSLESMYRNAKLAAITDGDILSAFYWASLEGAALGAKSSLIPVKRKMQGKLLPEKRYNYLRIS